MTLGANYKRKTNAKVKAFRVTGSLQRLTGLFSVEYGSLTVRTTADVRAEIKIGDIIKVMQYKIIQ